MNAQTLVFTLSPAVDMPEAEATLALAHMTAESLHGSARLQLEAQVSIDRGRRQLAVHPAGRAGQDLVLILTGFLKREFGASAIQTHWRGGRV
jgi:hypothetical protein